MTEIKSFSNLTEFKEETWLDFQEAVHAGEYSLGLDATRAREIAEHVGTGVQRSWLMLLVFTPVLTAVALLAISFLTGKYFLLFGIPIVFAAQFLAAGLVARQGSGLIPLALMAGATAIAVGSGWVLAAVLAGVALLQFVTRKLWYLSNTRIARVAIKRSEPIFLAAFLSGITSVRDNVTGKIIWAEKR